MSVAVLVALAVVTAGGEAWAKNWNLSAEQQREADLRKLAENVFSLSRYQVCSNAVDKENRVFSSDPIRKPFVDEARRRNDTCGVDPITLLGNAIICNKATREGFWDDNPQYAEYVREAQRRRLYCGVRDFSKITDEGLCNKATRNGSWDFTAQYQIYVRAAKLRGLNCGVGDAGSPTQSADSQLSCTPEQRQSQKDLYCYLNNQTLCSMVSATNTGGSTDKRLTMAAVNRGLTCAISKLTNVKLCAFANNFSVTQTATLLNELAVRGLNCGVAGTSTNQIATSASTATNGPTSAELAAERQKRIKLEQQLAALKAQQEQRRRTISSDTQKPTITASASSNGTDGIISGTVRDNVEVAEVLVDGQVVALTSNGSFATTLYIPRAGKSVEIVAVDAKGNKATKSLFLERGAVKAATGPVFASLNPSGKRVTANKDALALIIGVADYQRTPAKAAYADKDAKTFYDYALLKLGIPAGNIKELVNMDASRIDVGLAVKDWLSRSAKRGKSDVYVFFAGHGLASQSGEQIFLLPYDGEPRLLEDSAISRNELFADIASANPRSVTVFLDTCYSGTTRGTDMLIASRPVRIKAAKKAIPDNFTLLTAAAGDQTAKPLEEAKHGMFSYFLMKGMEGDADANKDNKITAGELHQYVQQNVVQQSSGSQTPELQGDADRVLVRFQ